MRYEPANSIILQIKNIKYIFVARSEIERVLSFLSTSLKNKKLPLGSKTSKAI